jgi:hypothetical protein
MKHLQGSTSSIKYLPDFHLLVLFILVVMLRKKTSTCLFNKHQIKTKQRLVFHFFLFNGDAAEEDSWNGERTTSAGPVASFSGIQQSVISELKRRSGRFTMMGMMDLDLDWKCMEVVQRLEMAQAELLAAKILGRVAPSLDARRRLPQHSRDLQA